MASNKASIKDETIKSKVCTKCKVIKPLTCFGIRNTATTKLDSWCKECKRAYQKEYYYRNKESVNQRHKSNYINNRENVLGRTKKYREQNSEWYTSYKKSYNKNNKEKLSEYNKNHYDEHKDRYRKVRKKYYENNKEKFKVWHGEWIKNNKHKANLYAMNHHTRKRLLPDTFTSEDLERLLHHFNFSCALSGVSEDIHLDHFICLNTGHSGTLASNIIPLSSRLNISKNDRNPFDWIKNQDQNIQDRFTVVVTYLAAKNNLSAEEFEEYTNWCYNNRRSIEEIKNDPRYSLEIWKENS